MTKLSQHDSPTIHSGKPKMSPTKVRIWQYGTLASALFLFGAFATCMPGRSYRGAPPPLNAAQRTLEPALREHVRTLATAIGPRNVEHPTALRAAQAYILRTLETLGPHSGTLQLEDLERAGEGAQNILFEVPGVSSSAVVVVGAHYDSCLTSPGANDNGSGVATALELAKSFAAKPARSTVRFAFFANEEPPFFKRPGMGSRSSAQNARRRGDAITAMLALETMGYYRHEENSQHYPWPIGLLYPSRGDFIAFVGDLGSRALVREAIGAFRAHAAFPSEGAALPVSFPGIDWSDHGPFRNAGYAAIMVTDTALYRDPNYHRVTDLPANLNYDALARVTLGLEAVLRQLAR